MTVMADVAAKREARRRRILENSELRLQRITGHVNHDGSCDEKDKTAVENQSTASDSPPNGILMNDSTMPNQTIDSLLNEINANIDLDDPFTKSTQSYAATQELFNGVLSGQNILHRRNLERPYVATDHENMETFNSNDPNDLRLSQDRQAFQDDSPLYNLEREARTANASTTELPLLLTSVFSSRLIYVLLAIIVNIMVVFKLDHLFGTSIIVPFFLVMIGRLGTFTNDDSDRGNNMLVAALILSNCRPELVRVIQKLKGTFSLFGKISRDLAVYIFTFVLLYNMISRYKNDLNDLSFAKQSETIFTDDVAM